MRLRAHPPWYPTLLRAFSGRPRSTSLPRGPGLGVGGWGGGGKALGAGGGQWEAWRGSAELPFPSRPSARPAGTDVAAERADAPAAAERAGGRGAQPRTSLLPPAGASAGGGVQVCHRVTHLQVQGWGSTLGGSWRKRIRQQCSCPHWVPLASYVPGPQSSMEWESPNPEHSGLVFKEVSLPVYPLLDCRLRRIGTLYPESAGCRILIRSSGDIC